jgi:hypothetical protein
MADDFHEHDHETPTEADLDQAYGSRFLSVADVGNRKIRTTIVRIKKEDLPSGDGAKRPRFVVSCAHVEKPMVLNPTNTNELVENLGRNPAKWKGVPVGLYVDPNVTYAGKRVGGLRLRVLGPSRPAVSAGLPEPPLHDGTGIEDMSDSIPI